MATSIDINEYRMRREEYLKKRAETQKEVISGNETIPVTEAYLQEIYELIEALQEELRNSYSQQDLLKKELNYYVTQNNKLRKELSNTSFVLTETKNELERQLRKREEIFVDSVVFEEDITLVNWSDNSYTVIEGDNTEDSDKESNLAAAVFKRLAGNDDTYKKITEEWIERNAIQKAITNIMQSAEKPDQPERKNDINLVKDIEGSDIQNKYHNEKDPN